jgi:hypothetical protein
MTMSSQQQAAFSVREPIKGYQTGHLIGRGGYGEVWKAAAPGGLAKAIKIVYGDANSERVASELRALNRVKDIRHPFLLSLERVEMVSGNLVLVTELADGNLKDVYQTCRTRQLPGIPQDQLLSFCRDVADGLDYMYSECSLQHLDVKPENILVIGNRAKLGDYGLVKHLYERSCSLVGGLTPIYSPPELFEGKPTRFSDQYSLAIVYMEMLTGVLPFIATNTAQLAAQHLKGVPDVSRLSRSQASVIARGLSKDPAQRFTTCREMIDALQAAADRSDSPIRLAETHRAVQSDTIDGRQVFDAAANAELEIAAKQIVGNHPSAPPQLSRQAKGSFGPTLIVGLGNTGGKVLHRFLARFGDRIGPLGECPWLQAVAIDTDARRLNTLLEDRARMSDVRTVPIPLQRPDCPINGRTPVLDWLDRRWFYNIPRNLSTAGCRPLARLALILNASRMADALAHGIASATRTAPASTVSERVGLPFAGGQCRVIFVGSISGGTSGGCLLDMAYAARAELKRQQLNDATVDALLMHSTPRGKIGRDKAITNALATLRELNHYSRPGGCYPGEAALAIPPFHGDNAPFQSVCFGHLGDHCNILEWENGIDRMAEALYCWTLTTAGECLPTSWNEGAAADARQGLTSLEMVPLGTGTDEIIAQTVTQACTDVVKGWRDGRDASLDHPHEGAMQRTALIQSITHIRAQQVLGARSDDYVREQLQRVGLTNDQMIRRCYEVVSLELGTDPASPSGVARIVDEAMGNLPAGEAIRAEDVAAIIELLDRLLQDVPEEEKNEAVPSDSLYERLVARLSVRESREIKGFLEWIVDRVDVPNERIDGARHAATVAVDLLQEMQVRFREQAQQSREKSFRVALGLRDPNADLFQAPQRCVHKTVMEAIWKQLRVIEGEIGVLIERLNEVSCGLGQLCDRIGKSSGQTSGDAGQSQSAAANRYDYVLAESLTSARGDLARKVEAQMDRQVLSGQSGLRRFICDRGDVAFELAEPLQKIARATVLRQVGAINRSLLTGERNSGKPAIDINFAEILSGITQDAHAPEDDGPGQHIVIVPDGVNLTAFEACIRGTMGDAMICAARTDEIAVCSVRHGESGQTIANRIMHGVRAFDELAGRVLTRVDVKWDPIEISGSDSSPVPVGAYEGLEVTSRTSVI